MGKVVKQRDIALHLGISQSMVARALGDDLRISPVSRRRVREAARHLGYDPEANHSARHLIAGRYGRKVATHMIGCLFMPLSEDIDHLRPSAYATHLLQGIRVGAHLAGYDVLLANPVRTLHGNRVDGLICCSTHYWKLIQEYYADTPLVMLTNPALDGWGVTSDDDSGIRQSVGYLLELGHRRIAYLISQGSDPVSQSRVRAYRETLRAAGIAAPPEWVHGMDGGESFRGKAKANMARWLREGWSATGCTALLVQNDEAAQGAMEALRDADLRVPDDISVIGFDGVDDSADNSPRLTTVRVPLRDMGMAAMELLVERMAGDDAPPRSIVLPTTLVARDSTAPRMT